MIGIFEDGRRLTDLEAEPRGGLLVSVENRADLARVIGLCLEVERTLEETPVVALPAASHNERLLRRLYGRLVGGGEGLAQQIDVSSADEVPWRSRVEAFVPGSEVGVFEGLILALATLFEAWEEPDESESVYPRPALHLLFALAVHAGETVELRFANPKAALVLQPGSLAAVYSFGTMIKAKSWVATVVAKGIAAVWRSPDAAGKRLVEGARQRAQAQGTRHLLWRLDQLKNVQVTALQQAQLVLIFLHGLFSTDLGTFDGLIDYLDARDPRDLTQALRQSRAENAFRLTEKRPRPGRIRANDVVRSPSDKGFVEGIVKGTIGMIGWPHNTLTSVRANAGALADLIGNIFSPNGPKLAFVCHSRGGLVARAAAVELVDVNAAWSGVLSDIITFGTPHEGAGIAEHNLGELATYFLGLQSTSRVASLIDVLVYLEARTSEGIEQLKPAEATTKERERAFVDELFDRERKLKGADPRRLPPVMAVGGRLDGQVCTAWRKRAASAFMKRWLDTPDHDLIVELESSTSGRLNPEITVVLPCDHFSYFNGSSADYATVFDQAAARIWSHVDLEKAFQSTSTSPHPMGGTQADPDWVTIGSVRIKRRRPKAQHGS